MADRQGVTEREECSVGHLNGWCNRNGVVAVAVVCGEVEIARAFGCEPDALRVADVWADGFRAGADAFNGHERCVYVLPRDISDVIPQGLRAKVIEAGKVAKPWA